MHCHVAEGLAFALDVRNVVEKVFYLSSFVFRFLTSLEKKTAILSNFIYILFIYLSLNCVLLVERRSIVSWCLTARPMICRRVRASPTLGL